MPKRTFQPKTKKIKRKAGFRARSRTKSGTNIIKRRMKKGAKKSSPFDTPLSKMLSVNHRLSANKDITKVKKTGKTTNTRLFTILKLFRKDSENSKVAFIISKNVSKKAVLRNKIKRSLSEGVRHNIAYLKPGYDIVIIAKPSSSTAYTEDIMKEVAKGLTKANLLTS